MRALTSLQPGDLGRHHRVRDGIVGLPELALQGGILILGSRCGCGLGGLGRLGRSAPHHQRAGAVVDIGIGPEIAVVDGALHGGAAPVGINACGCKEFVQRDIIPGPNDLVQLALQLAGLLHPQAHGQRSAAANGLGQRGQKLAPVEPVAPQVNDIGKACKAHHQKDAAEHRAEAGQGLVPLLAFCCSAVGTSWP